MNFFHLPDSLQCVPERVLCGTILLLPGRQSGYFIPIQTQLTPVVVILFFLISRNFFRLFSFPSFLLVQTSFGGGERNRTDDLLLARQAL